MLFFHDVLDFQFSTVYNDLVRNRDGVDMETDGHFKNLGFCAPPPGTKDTINCGICDEKMQVTRNVFGPTSFAESMGGSGHLHDRFRCPFYYESWHKRIVELIFEANRTASTKIKKIILEEIAEILETKRLPEE